jgi:hypothetical protein
MMTLAGSSLSASAVSLLIFSAIAWRALAAAAVALT